MWEVKCIYEVDLVVNYIMGNFGVSLIVYYKMLVFGVIIYCNIGFFVIGGYGIVLGVICSVW